MRSPSMLLMVLALIAATVALVVLAATPKSGAGSNVAADSPAQSAPSSNASPPKSPGQPSAPTATAPTTQPSAPRIEELTIAGELYKLEVSADEESRQRGLMHRDRIDDHRGMIFIFPRPALLSFWMKNCIIDIDVMFLDAHGVITATHAMKKEPPRGSRESEFAYEQRLKKYPSRRAAQFAIELRAGEIERLQLRPGQVIQIDLDRLKELARE